MEYSIGFASGICCSAIKLDSWQPDQKTNLSLGSQGKWAWVMIFQMTLVGVCWRSPGPSEVGSPPPDISHSVYLSGAG